MLRQMWDDYAVGIWVCDVLNEIETMGAITQLHDALRVSLGSTTTV